MPRTLAFGYVNKFAKETLALVHLTLRLARGNNGCFNNWRTLHGRANSVHLTFRLARGSNGCYQKLLAFSYVNKLLVLHLQGWLAGRGGGRAKAPGWWRTPGHAPPPPVVSAAFVLAFLVPSGLPTQCSGGYLHPTMREFLASDWKKKAIESWFLILYIPHSLSLPVFASFFSTACLDPNSLQKPCSANLCALCQSESYNQTCGIRVSWRG